MSKHFSGQTKSIYVAWMFRGGKRNTYVLFHLHNNLSISMPSSSPLLFIGSLFLLFGKIQHRQRMNKNATTNTTPTTTIVGLRLEEGDNLDS
mmetsp:Transcript_5088/g.5860  ORF Transcript_5088/g.5860 Transcript_5088/m.5860 type:complete len:92 (-) Transcript_5088:1412-1687(-)